MYARGLGLMGTGAAAGVFTVLISKPGKRSVHSVIFSLAKYFFPAQNVTFEEWGKFKANGAARGAHKTHKDRPEGWTLARR